MSSDFLFAMPSFTRGVGSVVDLAGTAEEGNYNLSRTPAEADMKALASDWLVTGRDIDRAIRATKPDRVPR